MPVRIFTSADGLGSSFIAHLMRDSRGFLWFCTRDGLTRFDGSHFVTYQVGTKDAPPGIEYIHEARNGIYWISTTAGLYRFDPNSPAPPQDKNNDRPVLNAEFVGDRRGNFYEDKTGRLWLMSNGLFLTEEKNGATSFQKLELNLPENPSVDFAVSAIVEDADGSFWILTPWGLVRRLADGREIFYSAEAGNTDVLTSLLKDGDGRIWLSRTSGIYVIKPEALAELTQTESLTVRKLETLAQKINTEKEIRFPERSGEIFKFEQIKGFDKSAVKLLYQTSDRHIWISSAENLIEFDGREFHSYSAEQGISGSLGRMLEDANGNLWIGGPKGLMRLNRQGLTTYKAADGLKTLSILTFNETKDGKLIIGAGDFFLSEFDGKKFQTTQPTLPAGARSLWSSNPVFLDSRNEWWFLTNEKLFRYRNDLSSLANQSPLAAYTSENGLKGNLMFHIFEDQQGEIWISTRSINSENFGLSKWNRADDKFYTFSETENFPDKKSVSAFAEDASGNLWFGFYEGGLVKYSGGRFTEIAAENDLLKGVVTALRLDKKERLWISTSLSGLSRIDDLTVERPNFVNYKTENGLSSNNIRSITEDDFGQIYAGTARGVDRITPETGQIKHYSTNDGLAGDFVQTAFRAHDGTLWFGTPSGVSRLVPTQSAKSNSPSVWLSGLRIAGENQPVAELGSAAIENLELSPSQNNLQIEFFGIDFNPSESLRYQYMLEGADADWSAPTEQRTVIFSNLSAGNYRFLVRAVNSDGATSENPAVVSFKLLPPVWRRWWFIAAVILLAGAGFYAFYRYRLAKLKAINAALRELQKSREERLAELERVRLRIARDLHDDIGASLSQIAIYSEVAKQKDGKDAGETLQTLVNVSKELVDSMSDIVWAINPRKDHLQDLTQRMRHFASEILTAAEIDLEFTVPEERREISLGANIRREVFLIFKETVNNIAKHSGATTAEIEFSLENDELKLRFKDNGGGFKIAENGENEQFDWERSRGGNGLASIKKRSQELGGEYKIESQLGKGTLAVLKIPLGNILSDEIANSTRTGND